MSFSGEGTEDWLEKQLDKLLAAAPTLAVIHPPTDLGTGSGAGAGAGKTSTETGTLPSFLQKKNAMKNHVRRFLATAEWLHQRGANRIQTADVAKALATANQPRLTNPSECLNQNVGKGHCEKDGKTFFVTPDGKTHLG
ncbi:hypothetical protein B0B52_10340 [Polaromonas sp. A23]|nr:hypothetical protein B0B52_10340 [Polaromonas sp. A23]